MVAQHYSTPLPYQVSDADLDAIAALVGVGLLERTGDGTSSIRALGVAGAGSVPTRADADTRYAAAAHTQAATTLTFSATNKVAGRATSGAGAGEELDCSAAGRALLAAANAAAQRTALELGAAAQRGVFNGGTDVGELLGVTSAVGAFANITHTQAATTLTFTATDRIAGRSTAGAGAGEEIPCKAAARTFLNLNTPPDQSLAVYSAGAWNVIGPGTEGDVLGIVDGSVAWKTP